MVKKCQWCNNEYNGRKDSRYCSAQHFKNCENCDELFPIKEMKRPAKSCSKKCSDTLTLKGSQVDRECELCNKIFTTSNKRARFCSDTHYSTCEVCGNEYIIVDPHQLSRSCSKQCAWKLVDDVDDVVAKRRESSLINHGVSNPSQSDEIKNKKVQSSILKYGVENVSQAFEVQQKREQTMMDRFGVPSVFLSDKVKDKIKASNIQKYGVENVFMRRDFQEKSRAAIFEKYGVENIFLLPENQLKAAERSGRRISKVNKDWQLVLEKETGVRFEFEQEISKNMYADLGYENVLIDINPTITHNNTVSFVHAVGRCTEKDCEKKAHLPRERDYHHKRAIAAEKEGKVLLQYFDWYDPEIFLNIVKSKLKVTERKIYARKTVLKEISQAEANTFFRENHLMGASNKQTLCLGLFFEDELVHCQTYGLARMSKKAEWEAIRSASKINTHIVGAFSKCDKFFFKKIQPKSVISYVDLSISHGGTEAMFDGWSVESVNKASATWTKLGKNDSGPMFVRESTARRVSADRLLGFEVGDKYPRLHEDGSKVTNDFVFISEGYVKVYDAGTKTFMWRNTEAL